MAKTGFAKQQLRSFVDRVERLEEERAALSADIREVYAEAKGTGFDTKILRQVIRLRKLDKADFQEQEAMLDLYIDALDMRGTPLGEYAETRQEHTHVTTPEQALAIAKRPVVKEAVKAFGTPVALTEEEKDAGYIAAFEKNGSRVSIGMKPAMELPAFLDRRAPPATTEAPPR